MRNGTRWVLGVVLPAGLALAACAKSKAVGTAATPPSRIERAGADAVSAPSASPVGANAESPSTTSLAPLATIAAAPEPVPVTKAAPPRPSAPRPALGREGDGLAGAPAAPPPRAAGVGLAAGPFAVAASAAAPVAGEWDDNANYREFTKWLSVESSSFAFPRVDVSHRRFLVVRDADGRAVPGCRVTVSAGGNAVTLTTGPSGRALLFPHAEGLVGDAAVATADCGFGNARRSLSLADQDGLVDLPLPTPRTLPTARTIDVAFVLDTTGSMSEEIASVQSAIAQVAAGLGQSNVTVRVGLVEFKDRGDPFVTRVYPFSKDVKGFGARVSGLSASGGGDAPESVNEGFHVALTGLDWSPTSVGRFAFLVGDAPPHLDYQQDFSYATDMKAAAHRGIQVFTVAASGMDVVGQVVWRQIAQYTGGSNMFVLRGGAGPQSTGAGDPRTSCGGTQTGYTSGHLDALILGKIRGELAALDGDPLRIAGLHEDENAKPCAQRVVAR